MPLTRVASISSSPLVVEGCRLKSQSEINHLKALYYQPVETQALSTHRVNLMSTCTSAWGCRLIFETIDLKALCYQPVETQALSTRGFNLMCSTCSTCTSALLGVHHHLSVRVLLPAALQQRLRVGANSATGGSDWSRQGLNHNSLPQ